MQSALVSSAGAQLAEPGTKDVMSLVGSMGHSIHTQ